MEKEQPRMPDREGDAWQEKEKTRTEVYKQNLDESRRFTPPTAEQLEAEVKERTVPVHQWDFQIHQRLFNSFYRELSYDQRTEFAKQVPEEKNRLFNEWREKRRKKTA